MTLFNLDEARRLKEEGIKQAANNPMRPLDHARIFATLAVRKYGEVTADDVYRAFKDRDMDFDTLGNAAGAIFRGPEWQFTGKWRASTRPSNHARMLRVWRLA